MGKRSARSDKDQPTEIAGCWPTRIRSPGYTPDQSQSPAVFDQVLNGGEPSLAKSRGRVALSWKAPDRNPKNCSAVSASEPAKFGPISVSDNTPVHVPVCALLPSVPFYYCRNAKITLKTEKYPLPLPWIGVIHAVQSRSREFPVDCGACFD